MADGVRERYENQALRLGTYEAAIESMLRKIYAALQEFCNFEVRKTRRLAFNPVYAVELEPEERAEADHWSAAEEAAFLAASRDDPLHLLFRIVLLRGPRRGEAAGFRWSGADLDAGYLSVERPILQLGGAIVEGKAKSKAGERKIWLDAEPSRCCGSTARRSSPRGSRPAPCGRTTTWCSAEGRVPWPPDYISRRFKAIAGAAGCGRSNCTRAATARPASPVPPRSTRRSAARPSATPTRR